MGNPSRETVTVTTDGSGDATAYSGRLTGLIAAIRYVKATSGSYTDGVDFAVSCEDSTMVIWDEDNVNASTIRYPRCAVHDYAGAAISGGYSPIALFGERVKIVVASGGSAKTGTFEILLVPTG